MHLIVVSHSFLIIVSFFPDHCLIQDLSTKWIISRGREYGDLYILETEVPKSVACFRLLPHSNYIVA